MHSLHKSQYCLSCKSYFTGGTLAGQHFCGQVELNDKKKSSPSYTKVLTEEKAKFICRYCSKSFVRQAYYKEHELRHRVVTHHRCDCCGLYFPNAHKCQSHKHKATCTPLILDPFLQTADHSESIQEKSDIPDVVETVGSNVELRNCFVKLMDVCKTSQSPERMHCQVCGKTFRLRAQLNAHLRSHSDEKPFKCDNCEKELLPPKEQATPQKLEEIYKEEFKCGLCQEAFVDSKALSEHCLTHMPGPSASKCQFCKSHFSSRAGLIRHIRLHTGEKPFPCLTCGRHFHRKEVLKLHQIKCTVHVRLHTGEKPYGCANCGEHFIRTDYLKRHLAKCNGKGEKEKILCEKCGDLFTRDALSVHQKTCVISSKSSGSSQQVNDKDKSPTKIKGFPCANCSDRFLLFSQLQQHFLAKHRSDQPQNKDQQQLVSSHMQVIKQEQVDEGYGQNQESSSQINTRERRVCSNTDLIKPLKCPQCNMRFSRSTGLGMHMRIHKGVYPLSCTKCHVGFWTRKTMEKHRRKCTGHTLISNNGSAMESAGELNDTENDPEKGDVSIHKYQCSECDQSFTDGLRLISHLEEHGREDQERRSDIHRCHVCNKVFAQAGILQRHSPHRCTKCHLSFTRSTELAEHMVTHRDENFPCDLCDETFSCKTSRAEHRK
uniref:C2H2-type domain-containing protein n=1 Tax=Cyprinus carpio TaxID=7962 RepID=A0A8C1XL71_CYPCA